MCTQHEIAIDVINNHIFSSEPFSYEEVTEEIVEKGGILRVSIGVTIGMYLKKLVTLKVISFDPNTSTFKATKREHILAC